MGDENSAAAMARAIALVALGVVALFSVYGLLYLSSPPYQSLETPETTNVAAASSATARNQSILGLNGQIVTAVGAIGAAAVGGIAGLLVGHQRPGQPGTGEGQGTEEGQGTRE